MKKAREKFVRNTQPTDQKSERLWKIYHSSNQRHERLYFKVVGNKRAVFCKNKMEEDAATFAYSLSLRGRQNLDRTGSDYRSNPVRDPIRSNLDFVDAALLEGTIDDFIDEQENRNTRAKTDRDVNLLKTSLQRKIELRNVEEMLPFFFFRFYKLYIYFNSPGPLWIPASLLNGLPWLKVTYLLTPAQLNEMLCDFALSVRAKDGNDYEG